MKARWRIAAVAAAILAAAACAGPAPTAALPTASADAAVVLFIGDSYTVGMGLAPAELATRWSTVLAGHLGWTEVNAGCSGSGYTLRGPRCEDSYGERLASLASTAPDIVIVSGGVNDLYSAPALIDTEVHAMYQALRAAFPDAQLYAVNGIYFAGSVTPPPLVQLNGSVAAAIAEVGGTYLDIGEPLLGRADLLTKDGVHPNPAGHRAIADATIGALERTGAYSPG